MVSEYPKEARSTHRYLVRILLTYPPKPNGLPESRDLKNLSRIEDRTEKAMKPYGGILIGHWICRGEYEIVLMARQSPPTTLEVRSGLFRRQSLRLKVTEDPDWSWVDEHMTLSDEDIERHRNRMLIQQLVRQGDQIHLVRPVDFALIFKRKEDRTAFAQAAVALGYRVASEGEPDPNDGSLWLELVADTTVEEEPMAARCVYLSRLAAEFNGEYDGWATPIVKR